MIVLPSNFAAVEQIYQEQKWRVRETNAKALIFFKRLLFGSLKILKYPCLTSELQLAINQTPPNELFKELRSTNPNKIPMMSCGGPTHSSHVINLLKKNLFFSKLLNDIAWAFPGGIIGKGFVSSYDSSIPRKTTRGNTDDTLSAIPTSFAGLEAEITRCR